MKSIPVPVFVEGLHQHYPFEACHLRWDEDRPWTLLFAVILSAQCTDKMVNTVTPKLFATFGDLESFVARPVEELEGLIRSTGFYRAKAKSLRGAAGMLLQEYDGVIPDSIGQLTHLPGVGRKTANVVLWNLYGINEGFVVDTHVQKITRRAGFTRHKDPLKIEQDLMRVFPQEQWGILSHQMVQFGRDLCRAPKPKCESCFFRDRCPQIGVKTKHRE